jgi:4-hydroxy-4-methyl-2-oxoglutarate aldolase
MEKAMDDDHVKESLLRLGTATVAESGATPMDPELRAIRPGMRLCGPAFPVVCMPGDNLAIHVAVAESPPGSVLAVSVGDLPNRGYWGEVLTIAASYRGIGGLVIDGCVRDTDTFVNHFFPVFARGAALKGTSKDRGGSVGMPAVLCGVTVGPGDWLLGDADGVAVVRRHEVEEVVTAGNAREQKEQKFFAALRAGSTTLELLSLSPEAVHTRLAPEVG